MENDKEHSSSVLRHILCVALYSFITEFLLHRENRENDHKDFPSRKTWNLEIMPEDKEITGNFLCSSCQF